MTEKNSQDTEVNLTFNATDDFVQRKASPEKSRHQEVNVTIGGDGALYEMPATWQYSGGDDGLDGYAGVDDYTSSSESSDDEEYEQCDCVDDHEIRPGKSF